MVQEEKRCGDQGKKRGQQGNACGWPPESPPGVQGALQPPHCSEVSCVINTGLQVRKRASGLWLGARAWSEFCSLAFSLRTLNERSELGEERHCQDAHPPEEWRSRVHDGLMPPSPKGHSPHLQEAKGRHVFVVEGRVEGELAAKRVAVSKNPSLWKTKAGYRRRRGGRAPHLPRWPRKYDGKCSRDVSIENKTDLSTFFLILSLCTYFLCRQLQEAFPVKAISSKPLCLCLQD